MPHDKYLAERVDRILIEKNALYYQKVMFGSLWFMIEDKMTLGIVGEELYVRVGKKNYKDAIQLKGAKEMNFSGKVSSAAIYVDPFALDTDEDLEFWVQYSLDNLYGKLK